MRTDLECSRRTVSALLFVAVGLAGCAAVAPPPVPSLPQQVAAARTRADHEALVTYFKGEAAAARATAAEHREMIKAYERQVAGGRSNINMATHCNLLIQGYESIATDYDLLADGHRQMALQANP